MLCYARNVTLGNGLKADVMVKTIVLMWLGGSPIKGMNLK